MLFHYIKKDPKLFFEIAFFSLKMSVAKKIFGFEKIMEIAEPKKKVKIRNKKKFIKKLKEITSYFIKKNFFGKKNCYDIALINYHFLRKIGLNAVICFGIDPKKITQQIEGGHAWIELHQQPQIVDKKKDSLKEDNSKYVKIFSYSK